MKSKLGILIAGLVFVFGCNSLSDPDKNITTTISPYMQDALKSAYLGKIEIKSADKITILKKIQDDIGGKKVNNVIGYFYCDFLIKVNSEAEGVKSGDVKKGVVFFVAKLTQGDNNTLRTNSIKVTKIGLLTDKTKDQINKDIDNFRKINDNEFHQALVNIYNKGAYIANNN